MLTLAKILIYGLIRILSLSYRYRVVGEDHRRVAENLGPQGSYLLALWHETLITVSVAQMRRRFCAMASKSTSGAIGAFVMQRLGYLTVLGSKSKDGHNKGGKDARVEVERLLLLGIPNALTVDGSVGPRRYCKAGIVDLAKRTRAPILPSYSHPQSMWRLKTWDRLRIPKPFSKVLVLYGPPIVVPETAQGEDFAAYQEAVKVAIDDLERSAEEQFERLFVTGETFRPPLRVPRAWTQAFAQS